MAVESETTGLGNDGFNSGSMARLVFYTFLLFFFYWIMTNIPQEFNKMVVYTGFLFIGLVMFALDRIIKRREYIDTIFEEGQERRPFIFNRISTKAMVIFFVLFSIIFFFSMWKTGFAIVGSPTFDVVPFGDNKIWAAILSGLVGIAENLVFFGWLFPSLVAIFSSRISIFGVPVGIALTTGAFTAYHFLVYGPSNVVGTTAVIIGGLIFCTLAYVFRSQTPNDLIHFTNNFGSKIVPILGISPGVFLPF